MNPITKAIGAAFLNIGNRLRYGQGAAEGDFTVSMLPREVDARSQKGVVIRILSSWGSLVAFQYVCINCGTNNTVELFNIDRKCICQGGCGKEFSIRALSIEGVKRARLAANKTRGANISTDKPVTPEEFDNWLYTLPEHKPSSVTGKASSLQERLNRDDAVLEWVGAAQDENPMEAGFAFSDPSSGSWRR